MSWTPKDPIKRAAVLEALLLNGNSPTRYGVLWNKCKSSIGSKITFDLLLKEGCKYGVLKRIERSPRHVEFQIDSQSEKGKAILDLYERHANQFRYETQVKHKEIKSQIGFVKNLERAFVSFTSLMLWWVSWLAFGPSIVYGRPEKSSDYERALVERGLAAIQHGFVDDLKVLFVANPHMFRRAIVLLWNLQAINEGRGIDLVAQMKRHEEANMFERLTWMGYPRTQAALMAARYEEAHKLLKEKKKEQALELLREVSELGRFIIGVEELKPELGYLAKKPDKDLQEALRRFRKQKLERENEARKYQEFLQGSLDAKSQTTKRPLGRRKSIHGLMSTT
jgi:hypothetical protein